MTAFVVQTLTMVGIIFLQVKVSGERSLRRAVPYTAGIRIAFSVKS